MLNLLNFAQSAGKCFNLSSTHKKQLGGDLTFFLLHFFEAFACLSGRSPLILCSTISTPTCLTSNDPGIESLIIVFVGSVVKWLRRRAHDQLGLGSKPTRAILLCPWERHFTALFPAWWSWQAVLN